MVAKKAPVPSEAAATGPATPEAPSTPVKGHGSVEARLTRIEEALALGDPTAAAQHMAAK